MPHYETTCVFCEIAQRKIEHWQFWENKHYIAFLDKNPQSFGHTLVIPKNHSTYVFNLHKKEYTKLLVCAEEIAKVLKKQTKCNRVALAIYGFEVDHTHVHLIPLNSLADVKKKIKKPTKKEMDVLAHELEVRMGSLKTKKS